MARPVVTPQPQPFTLGDQQIEPGIDPNSSGVAEAYSATASTGGSISSMSVYLDATSAATSVVLGLYSDAAGHPVRLLTQGTVAAPVARGTRWRFRPRL